MPAMRIRVRVRQARLMRVRIAQSNPSPTAPKALRQDRLGGFVRYPLCYDTPMRFRGVNYAGLYDWKIQPTKRTNLPSVTRKKKKKKK